MPYDVLPRVHEVPENLDFSVGFETTKFDEKKYVINEKTGDYLGVVGTGFKCASHKKFFDGVQNIMVDNIPDAMIDSTVRWSTARNTAWAMMDIVMPNVFTTVETEKHSTKIGRRVIALHGVDGSCSNQVFFGAIDFFCTNGSITGEYDQVRKKNTSNFTLEGFIYELRRARTDFYEQTAKMQVWAETDLKYVNVQSLLDEMIKSKRKSEKMYELYCQEASQRGHNKWALYSAFTNYASYADERNGFNLRNTGNDTQAISMFSREQEVSKWVSDKRFVELEAA